MMMMMGVGFGSGGPLCTEILNFQVRIGFSWLVNLVIAFLGEIQACPVDLIHHLIFILVHPKVKFTFDWKKINEVNWTCLLW